MTYLGSYLGFGKDQIVAKKNSILITGLWTYDPCSPVGYNYTLPDNTTRPGTGNFSECRSIILQIFQLTGQQFSSIQGIYEPSFDGITWVGISAYYYALSAYSNATNVTLAQFVSGAMDYCLKNASEVGLDVDPTNIVKDDCLLVTLASSLLMDAYNMSMSTQFYIASAYNGITFTYAYGAIIYELNIYDFNLYPVNQQNYLLMIDAGSSGSRIYVYQWNKDYSDITENANALGQLSEKKVSPGLGKFNTNTSAIAAYLQQLTDFAKLHVPANATSTTPLYLKATAGLRILSDADKNAILIATRAALTLSGFNFKSARIISGTEEGMSAWIGVNYLQKTFLQNNTQKSFGAIDLGGASTQITFEPPLYPEHNDLFITVGRKPYSLYSYSYLGLGKDQAILSKQAYLDANSATVDPCYPIGATTLTALNNSYPGSSDPVGCISLIVQLLQLQNDPTTGRPSIRGIYVADTTQTDFIAISAYVYAELAIGVPSVATFTDFAAATNAYCMLNSTQISQTDPFAKDNCFLSGLSAALLQYYYVDQNKNITFTNTINNVTVTYALGAALYEVDLIDDLFPGYQTTTTINPGTTTNTPTQTPTTTNTPTPTPTTTNTPTPTPTPTTINPGTTTNTPTPTPTPTTTPTPTPTPTETSKGSIIVLSILSFVLSLLIYGF